MKNMKKQIRKGVFETNSSSVHAICIPKTTDLIVNSADLKYYNGEVLRFEHGEYGWERETLYDITNKASYLYEALFCVYDKDELFEAKQHISDVLSKYNVTCEFEEVDEGCWTYGTKTYLHSSGYIDHGGELQKFVSTLLSDDDMLIKYLFDDDSFVMTNNDNDDDIENFYNCIEDYETKYDIFVKGN